MGRYLLKKTLGKGGFGVVYEAEDLLLKRPVAVKMSTTDKFSSDESIRELKIEALSAMKLSHPNIVTLRAFELENNTPFLVMDLVRGTSLQSILDQGRRLTADEVQSLFVPLARAFQYAHNERLIHRDIKPSNILLTTSGVPKIVDFGISAVMSAPGSKSATDVPISGTLPYMSPQQLMGKAPSQSQDVYSFAATIYAALTGYPPFYRGDIAAQIMHSLPESIPGIDPCVYRAIMLGLSKAEHRRPQSMDDFADLLTRKSSSGRARFVEEEWPQPFPASGTKCNWDEIVRTGHVGPVSLELVAGRAALKGAYDPVSESNWIEAEKGAEFLITIRNDSSRRIAAVIAVDGLSVFDRKPAAYSSRAYLIEPKSSASVPGWSVDDNLIDRFRFAPDGDAIVYGGQKAQNNGVIACAIFFEQAILPPRISMTARDLTDQESHVRYARRRQTPNYLSDLAVGLGSRQRFKVVAKPFRRQAQPAFVLALRYCSSAAIDRLGLRVQEESRLDDSRDMELDEQGFAPIHHAALTGDTELIRNYLHEGVDVNLRARPKHQNEFDGATPLHLAAGRADVTTMDLLLRFGADIEARTDSYGETPLHLCCSRDCRGTGDDGIKALRLLLTYGADTNAISSIGHSPLHPAAASLTPAHLDQMINAGALASLNKTDNEGDTPTDCAVVDGAMINAEYLRSWGGNSIRQSPRIPEFHMAERLAIVWNSGRLMTLNDILAESIDYESLSVGVRLQGRAAVIEYFGEKLAEFNAAGDAGRVFAELATSGDGGTLHACVVIAIGYPDRRTGIIQIRSDGALITSLRQISWRTNEHHATLSGWRPS